MRNTKSDSVYDRRRRKRRRKKKYAFSRGLGIFMAIVQFFLSVFFLTNVLLFNMLTSTYILILIGILLILLGIVLITQIAARGRGIGGKTFCFIICVVLAAGSFYTNMVNSAVQKITGNSTKTSCMAIAVLADDSAEKLSDTADYNFGVQYAIGSDQTKSALTQVEKELGSAVETTEYNNLYAEVQGLYDGEVQAIIFNVAQTELVSEQYETFEDDIRVIYTHNIVIEIENEAVDASMNEPFAVYLSGIDVFGDITQESRSDVNIIAVVNPQSHQILLVTTPRDYYVEIPGISYGQYDKLTHAGIYGVDASMATLEELYDVDIDFFGRVNFTSMIDIVDALGGLDVESDVAFTTSEATSYVFDVQEGMNHFNGKQALAFCRERKNLADGDNARGRHQEAVITAMIKKMVSPAMLRGATEIIESVSDGVDTNITTEQIQTLIKAQLRSNAKWSIYSVAAEGYGSQDYCYSSGDTLLYVTVPDETSVANICDLIDRVYDGEILEGSEVTE